MVPGVDVARGIVLDGRYRIDEVLGQGGMATVYRAHDEVLERDVAIKLFPPTPDADEVLRHRSEMRVLAQLSHPGLVMLHDAGSAYAGGPMQQTYLVMELVPGPTLADLLVAGPMPPRHVLRAGRQLAEALCAVHDAGVVHRDIKPANILLVDRRAVDEPEDATLVTGPVVKLADFGIARFSDGARLTMTGTTLGTATYLSPEQAAGAPVGPATDVYALGLVLLECLTGVKAFTGTMVEVAAARLNTSPAIPTALGQEWCGLLEGMTRRDPQQRISMPEVVTRLAAMGAEAVPAPAGADQAGSSDGPSAARPAGAGVEDVSTAAIELTPPPPTDAGTTTRRFDADEVRAHAAGLRSRDRARPVDTPASYPPGGPGPLSDGSDRGESEPDRWEAEPDLRESERDGRVATGGGDGPGPSPRARVPGRILAGATAVVLLVVAVILLTRPQVPAVTETDPPTYPQVDGELGEALDDLVESVQP